MKTTTHKGMLAAGLFAATFALALPASAQQISSSEFVTTVNITVVPFAALEFVDQNPLLYLEVPPAGSTIPSSGVNFTVFGNSFATLSAEPSSFMQVPTAQFFGVSFDPFLGRAVSPAGEIAYDFELRFPIFPFANNGLPLNVAGPAVSPLVDVVGAGGSVGGTLDLIANPNWTSDGGLALPGLYQGEIILTLTAS